MVNNVTSEPEAPEAPVPAGLLKAAVAIGAVGMASLVCVSFITSVFHLWISGVFYQVLKTVLALSGAGFATALTGFMTVKHVLPGGTKVVAGGAFAVFVVILFALHDVPLLRPASAEQRVVQVSSTNSSSIRRSRLVVDSSDPASKNTERPVPYLRQIDDNPGEEEPLADFDMGITMRDGVYSIQVMFASELTKADTPQQNASVLVNGVKVAEINGAQNTFELDTVAAVHLRARERAVIRIQRVKGCTFPFVTLVQLSFVDDF